MGARFGLWGRFPMVMGGGKPRAQSIYESMLTSRGVGRYSLDYDAIVNVDLQATAHQIDCAVAAQERGALQAFPVLATDYLTTWERGLGRTPDPTETEGQRRQMLDAILASNGAAEPQNIIDALAKALEGEEVTLVYARAPSPEFEATIALSPLPILTESTGGLSKGTHSVSFAFETADGMITATRNAASITIASDDASIIVSPVPLSTVTGATMVHYYLSVSAGSSLRSYVATTNGSAVKLSRYPVTPDIMPLHHIGVQVSLATFNNAVKRLKIDQVLGPMLSAWTTYEIITSSPFEVSVSELDRGAF